jgi:cell division protein FtsB
LKEFIKESFKNGNRLTNILLIVIMALISIVGYIAQRTYDKFETMQTTINGHDTKITVLEGKVYDIKERMLNDLKAEIERLRK